MAGLLKKLLSEQRVLRGFAVGRLPHVVALEIFGLSGSFDVVWLDQEHGGLTTEQIVSLNIAARANGLACFVRMPFTHYSLASQNLESGIDGVMAARIRSADEAREFVRWCKFAPAGNRGLNTSGADGLYTGKSAGQFAVDANRDNFVAIQIETVSAASQVDEIAAIQGVDMLFVGPSDLSQEMGMLGQPDCDGVRNVIQQVSAACKKHGKHWGIVATDAEQAERFIRSGCKLVSVTCDVAALRLGLETLRREFEPVFRQ